MTNPAQPEVPPVPPDAPVAPVAPVPPVAPAPQARGGKRRQITILVTLLVVLAVLGGLGWFFSRDAAGNAKAGDCLHQTGENSVKIVDCTSADADFTVLGKVADKDEIESTIGISSVCDPWPDTTSVYWEGEQGKKGDVLCLQKK
ncbi:LppU/SCO3897 family protein [Dactylosporangium sp. CA-092794]|uniref:LppU/SCO3897 family protein n=1 Tax=Dactylosporangium sp. CA-092794 TaxID=3239929 RepID=UPI003D8BCDA2